MAISSHTVPKSPSAAMRELLDEMSPMDLAKHLGINNAHVYLFRSKGEVTPMLKRRLLAKGYLAPAPKRYRLHYEAGRGRSGRERYEQVKAWLAEQGYDNLTEAVDAMIEDGD